ncbi:MAG: type II toxin-antitoxin system Phd/YefM family antitoxin [Oscillospiraceae bacterium]|nr:type II toxin-antitoxin system Phd/YefM family antitoxin [Oscillospiraceae bacterium]
MSRTHVRPTRDLRNNYAEIVRLLEQHDHVIITNNGVGESVLIKMEDYAKYEEYLHQQFIYDELQKSKAEAADPNTVRIPAEEVFSKIFKRLEERGL